MFGLGVLLVAADTIDDATTAVAVAAAAAATGTFVAFCTGLSSACDEACLIHCRYHCWNF